MFKPTLMKCRHIGYAETSDGRPYCPICDCDQIADESEELDLTNRKAKCPQCGKVVPSSYNLPFFQPRELFNPKSDWDSFYDGCCGWN